MLCNTISENRIDSCLRSYFKRRINQPASGKIVILTCCIMYNVFSGVNLKLKLKLTFPNVPCRGYVNSCYCLDHVYF